jgi:hypothetical protein
MLGAGDVAVGDNEIAEGIKHSVGFPHLACLAQPAYVVQVIDDGSSLISEKHKKNQRRDRGDWGVECLW